MGIDSQAISARLKQARELQALSLKEVAAQTGIATERLASIEAGGKRPSGDEVLILANFYRHDFRDFLEQSRGEPFRQTDILYRRYGTSFTGQDRRAIQEFLFLCEIEAFLERELGVKKTAFNFRPIETKHRKQGEEAALKLREVLGYNSRQIPRDVFSDFRQIGIHIFRRKLVSTEISGLYIEHPVAGHCVLINYDEDLYRQRFSVSHEVAHSIFDSSEAVTVTYEKGAANYDKQDKREQRANRFASCYLMPPASLPNVPEWNTDAALHWASMLQVSTAALSYALREAKHVDWATSKLLRSVRVPKNEKVEPEAPVNLTELQRSRRLRLLERGFSDYYVGLCFEAHHRGIISAGRLGEALLADHDETREISILYGRAMNHGA